MIGYVLILLLLVTNRELSNAMEVQINSSKWDVVGGRRTLLASQPLQSPVPSRPSRTNHSLVAVIVVLMVLAIAAIVCCCYLWEQQLRQRVEARNREPSSSVSLPNLVDGNHHHSPNSQLILATPSTMVVSIGGDLPHSMAWGIPHGIPANPSLGKLAPK